MLVQCSCEERGEWHVVRGIERHEGRRHAVDDLRGREGIGPRVVLRHAVGCVAVDVDRAGHGDEGRYPFREPDPAEQIEALRRCLYWFWHELSHFIAAMGRGQLWWAYGQLESMRGICVNLTRIELDVEAQDEMYWKVDQVVLTKRLSALHATFCPMEKEAMLRAVVDIVDFFRERAPAVAERYGSTYPTELERLMGARLDCLVEDLRSDR